MSAVIAVLMRKPQRKPLVVMANTKNKKKGLLRRWVDSDREERDDREKDAAPRNLSLHVIETGTGSGRQRRRSASLRHRRFLPQIRPPGFDRSIDHSLADAPKNPCHGRLMGQGPEGSGGARKNSNASRLTRRGFGRRGSSCCGAILAKRREAVQALGSPGPRSMSLYSRFIAILSVSRCPP